MIEGGISPQPQPLEASMKSVLNLVLVAILFFLPSTARAENAFEMNFQFLANEDGCKHARFFFFTHSSHPGGNPFNRFQENNPGYSVECRSKRNSDTSEVWGFMDKTSRDGKALFWGRNVRFYTPEFARVSVGVGAEFVIMYYEFRDPIGYNRAIMQIPPYLAPLAVKKLGTAENGFVIAPVPIGIVSLRYRLPENSGFLVFEQRHLAGLAKLYGVGWSYDF